MGGQRAEEVIRWNVVNQHQLTLHFLSLRVERSHRGKEISEHTIFDKDIQEVDYIPKLSPDLFSSIYRFSPEKASIAALGAQIRGSNVQVEDGERDVKV